MLVVDDRLSVRRGTELVLREASVRVVGVAGGAEEARALVTRRRHDALVLDPALRDGEGLALARELVGGPLVLHTDGPGLATIATLGAPGVALKSSPPQALLDAVAAVAAGATYADPALAAVGDSPADRLSPREREILALLAAGATGAGIARRLFLSSETVRTHVRNATQKLGARTRAQAIAIVVRHEYE